MTEDEDDSWEDYQSGPFCRHWSDPSDCDDKCATCGHECHEHYQGDAGECRVDGCTCEDYKDSEHQ